MTDPKSQTERLGLDDDRMVPELRSLFTYWSGLERSPTYPRWGGAMGVGFRLIDLPAEVLGILTVVDAGPTDDDFVYRFWGTARQYFLVDQKEPTGKPVAQGLHPINARNILAQYKEVYREGKPIQTRNLWPLPNGLTAECHTLRLPLCDQGDGVDKIVAATAFIRHADAFRKYAEEVT